MVFERDRRWAGEVPADHEELQKHWSRLFHAAATPSSVVASKRCPAPLLVGSDCLTCYEAGSEYNANDLWKRSVEGKGVERREGTAVSNQ